MSENINIYTIGFTKTTAENFFNRLIETDTKRIIDVRLNNTSQLSGFAKAKDLQYFLRSLVSVDYVHEPLLAPTKDILDEYKKNKGLWDVYEAKFLDLMDMRSIDEKLSPDFFDKGCLLCSEDKPHYCHRRLVLEYLNDRWKTNLVIKHL